MSTRPPETHAQQVEGCPLCSNIQAAVGAERLAVERLHESADAVGFRVLPPIEGEGVSEDEWMEYACRRDEYERVRVKRLRSDNRFFDSCPRCHFDLQSARRDLEQWRGELPFYRGEKRFESTRAPSVRATGS